MEPIKISEEVNNILEFLKIKNITIAEKIVILRSTADLLNQVIIMEAVSANFIATFKNTQK